MLWEHEPEASVSIAFSSSPKLSYSSIETRNACFLFLLETPRREKGSRLVSLSSSHHYVKSARYFLCPSRYTNTIFNQSACVLS